MQAGNLNIVLGRYVDEVVISMPLVHAAQMCVPWLVSLEMRRCCEKCALIKID